MDIHCSGLSLFDSLAFILSYLGNISAIMIVLSRLFIVIITQSIGKLADLDQSKPSYS